MDTVYVTINDFRWTECGSSGSLHWLSENALLYNVPDLFSEHTVEVEREGRLLFISEKTSQMLKQTTTKSDLCSVISGGYRLVFVR